MILIPRTQNIGYQSGDSWYNTPRTGIVLAIACSILGAGFVLWLIFGAWHVRHRIRHGKEPMLYHKLLVPAKDRALYWRGHSPLYVPQRPQRQRDLERQWPGGRTNARLEGDDLPGYDAEESPPKYQPPTPKPEDVELPDYAQSAEGSSSSLPRPSPSHTDRE